MQSPNALVCLLDLQLSLEISQKIWRNQEIWRNTSTLDERPVFSQGIIESANFRLLQRLSVIFGFRRDCPRSLASCRDYRPRKMASCIACPCNYTDSLCSITRTDTRTVSAGSYLPSTTVSTGSKRSRTVSAETKNDGQSLQEA